MISSSVSRRSRVRARTSSARTSLTSAIRWRSTVSRRCDAATVATAASARPKSGATTGSTVPELEGDLGELGGSRRRARGPPAPRSPRARATRPAAPPSRARRSTSTSEPGGRGRQRQSVEQRPDRVRLDLGARHQLVAGRGRVLVVHGGRGRPDRRRSCRAARAGSTSPRTREENETVGIVPGGPRKSMYAPPGSNAAAPHHAPLPLRPRPRQACAGRRPDRREAPDDAASLPVGQVAGARRGADLGEVLVSPEHVRVPVPVALARRQHHAPRAVDASKSAMSCRGAVGSVNCTSMTISRAPASFSRSTARPNSDRGNGHRRPSSENVTSSIATTTTSAGGCAPRSRKRWSTEAFSIASSTPPACAAPATAVAMMPAVSRSRSREPRARFIVMGRSPNVAVRGRSTTGRP